MSVISTSSDPGTATAIVYPPRVSPSADSKCVANALNVMLLDIRIEDRAPPSRTMTNSTDMTA